MWIPGRRYKVWHSGHGRPLRRSVARCWTTRVWVISQKKVYVQLFPHHSSLAMSHRALSAPLRAIRGTRLQQTVTRCASTKTPSPPKPIDDSTSALDCMYTPTTSRAASAYLLHIDKLHKHSRSLPHLVTQHPRSPSAEEAVTNILYNTPPPSTEPFKRSVCYCLFRFSGKYCKADKNATVDTD